MLRALGMRDAQMPQDTAERAGCYRQLLRERRALVILDDAAAEAQVRPLIPGDGDSRLLVTSRRLLAGLEGVQRLQLAPMPAADAHDLLGQIMAQRGDESTEDLSGLVDLLGGLPLAVRIAGNRLVSRPAWSAADLLARLSVADRRLDQLTAGDLTIAAAFGISYEQLPEATRQVFRRTALVPGTDFGAPLAAVAGEVSVPDAEDHLDDLVDLGLVDAAQGGRYRLHDLVRLYASQRLHQDEEIAAVASCRRRVVGWLLATLTDACRWFEVGLQGTPSSFFDDAQDAEGWVRMEAAHWYPAFGDAAAAGEHEAVVRAAGLVNDFAPRWQHWPHWEDVFTLGHTSALALGDIHMQADFLLNLAWLHSLPGRDLDQALDCAQQAIPLGQQLGDALLQGRGWMFVARVRYMRGDPAAALEPLRRAKHLYQQAATADDLCQVLLGEGAITLALGDVAGALAAYQRAVQMAENPQSGMSTSIATYTLPVALGHTARALGIAGRAHEGVQLALRSLQLCEQHQLLEAQGMVLRVLVDDLYGDDHPAEARQCLLQAAHVYERANLHEEAARCREQAAAKADPDATGGGR